MVSAVLISFNEAFELERCLRSIQNFADEIVVVDLNSNDETNRVLELFKVNVYKHKRVPYADPIRNWAISKAKGDWILMLDPDEQVPESLINKLKDFIKSDKSQKYNAVNIPFKNIFWGKWISHTNFWPDKHLRFFRKNTLSWQNEIHSYPKVEGLVLELESSVEYAIVHFGYYKRADFFQKQMKYAAIHAESLKKRGRGFSLWRVIWMPLREFLARFIKHQGYLDGFDGLYLVISLMIYQVMVEVNLLRKK